MLAVSEGINARESRGQEIHRGLIHPSVPSPINRGHTVMRDLFITLLVSGLTGIIHPRLGFFALCLGMGFSLMYGIR